MEAVSDVGLRERKKQATRESLIEVALELFAADGVDAVSVEQIAARVEVSARTFHRYFTSKDDVLFADSDDRRRRIVEALDARPADEPLLDTLRAAALVLVEGVAVDPRRERIRQRIVEGNDRLRARSLRNSEEFADVLAAHVARRLGVRPDAAHPRLLAGWTLASLRVVHRRWLEHPRVDLVAEVEAAFDLLAAGGVA
jgi:AcrR family transcriptional regulator